MGQCWLFHLKPFGAKHLPRQTGNTLCLGCPDLGAAQSLPFSQEDTRGHTHTTFSWWPWGRTSLHPRELHQSHQKTTLQINALVQLTPGKRKSTESLISACQGSRNTISTLFLEPAIYWALLRRPTSLLHPFSFHKPKCKAWQCILMGYTHTECCTVQGHLSTMTTWNISFKKRKKRERKNLFNWATFFFFTAVTAKCLAQYLVPATYVLCYSDSYREVVENV